MAMAGDGEDVLVRGGAFPRGGGRLRSPAEIAAEHAGLVPVREARQRPDDPPPPATPESEHPGGGPEFFDAEDAEYKAFGWAGNKTLPTLRVIFKDGSEWAIVYAHLDTHPVQGSRFLPSSPGRKGNLILLRVAGHEGGFLVEIEGIRLRRVWELLMGHLTPWIHELPPGVDFMASEEPVIWSVIARGIGDVL